MKFLVTVVASLACATHLASARVISPPLEPKFDVRTVRHLAVRDVPEPPMTCAGVVQQNVCRGYLANVGFSMGTAWDHLMDEIHENASKFKNSFLSEISEIGDKIERWGKEHNPMLMLAKLEDKSEEEIQKVKTKAMRELKSIQGKLHRARQWLHAEKIVGLEKLSEIGDSIDDTITNLENGFKVRMLLAKEIFSSNPQVPPPKQN